MADTSYKPKQKANTLKKSKKGGGLVFDIDRGELYDLNDTGFAIWNLCDGTKTVSDLMKALSTEYEAGSTDLKAVEGYVKELKAVGLLD